MPTDPPPEPAPLDRLTAAVRDVLRIVEKAGPEAAQTLGLLTATHEALAAVAAAIGTRGSPDSGTLLGQWLHDLRGLANVMVGWATVLDRVPLEDETRRQRARDAIERNARRLQELLASPPQ